MIRTLVTVLAAAACGTGALAADNLAPAGVASQSSTLDGGDAARANDGNRITYWGAGSVQHTAGGAGQWWQVQLPQLSDVQEIDVFNGQADEGCCAWRINGFSVTLYAGDGVVWTSGLVDTFVSTINAPGVSGMAFALPAGLSGDRVRVDKVWPNYLHMAEVEVWGSVSAVPEPSAWALWLAAAAVGAALQSRRSARAASATSAGPL